MAIPGQPRAQALDLRLLLRQFVNTAVRSSHRTPVRSASKLRSCFRPATPEFIRRNREWHPIQDIASQRPSIQIANPTHAPDSFRAICLWAQLLTKVAYMKVDAPIERRKFPAENSLRQSFPRKHLSGRLQECAQQIELCRRQVQGSSRLGRGICCQIHFQITRPDGEWPRWFGLLRLPTRSAEDGANTRNQFTRAERLRQIIVRTHL